MPPISDEMKSVAETLGIKPGANVEEQISKKLDELSSEKRPVSVQMPSVGRAVHYKAYGTPGGEHKSVFRAATITEVDEPGNPESPVGLMVCNPTGLFFNQHCKYGTDGGQWSWPAFVAPVAKSS